MKKIMYFDTETTGTDPDKNDIIQLSGVIEIDNEVVEEFDYKIQPHSFEFVEQSALDVNGITYEELKTFKPPLTIHREFTDLIGKHINKFDKSDKLYPAGYNVGFDTSFLEIWFLKCGDKWYGSWFNRYEIDAYKTMCILRWFEKLTFLKDLKLETVCDWLGAEIKAHDAMSDILATREIIKRIEKSTDTIIDNLIPELHQ